eukprot:1142657-Pelagomonas_calceolata.AAC.6
MGPTGPPVKGTARSRSDRPVLQRKLVKSHSCHSPPTHPHALTHTRTCVTTELMSTSMVDELSLLFCLSCKTGCLGVLLSSSSFIVHIIQGGSLPLNSCPSTGAAAW